MDRTRVEAIIAQIQFTEDEAGTQTPSILQKIFPVRRFPEEKGAKATE